MLWTEWQNVSDTNEVIASNDTNVKSIVNRVVTSQVDNYDKVNFCGLHLNGVDKEKCKRPYLKLECGDIRILALVDTGADVSVVKCSILSSRLLEEIEEVDEITVRGAFGQQIVCKLVKLPCRIFNPGNSDQVTNILCAVTDMLDQEEMLLSGNDFAILMDNCKKDRSVHVSEDDYCDSLPFLETILEEDEVLEDDYVDEDEDNNVVNEDDDVYQLNVLYKSEVRDDVDHTLVVNQTELLEDVGSESDEEVNDSQLIHSEKDKCDFSCLQRDDPTLESCFKEAKRIGGHFFVDKSQVFYLK